MSHNIIMDKVRIRNLTLLGQIAHELSKGAGKLNVNATTFVTYPGQPNKCDAAIEHTGGDGRINRNYGIGLVRQKDGAYTLVADPYGLPDYYANKQAYNQPLGKLLQEYTLREAEYQAAQMGYTSRRLAGDKGTVTLELVAAS
jgi:hypothetical protein